MKSEREGERETESQQGETLVMDELSFFSLLLCELSGEIERDSTRSKKHSGN